MPDTEMAEIEQPQHLTDFVRPPSRVANRVSLQPSTTSTVRLHSPRPTSSIYSRNMDNYTEGQRSIFAEADEKNPNRLDGWIHPAMRRARVSISSAASTPGGFSRVPSSDEQQQQHSQQQQTNRQSAGCTTYETCAESQPGPTISNADDAEQQAIPSSVQPASMQSKRRLRFYRAMFAFICVAILVILSMCICIAFGVFGRTNASETRRRWVLGDLWSVTGLGQTRPFIAASSVLPDGLKSMDR